MLNRQEFSHAFVGHTAATCHSLAQHAQNIEDQSKNIRSSLFEWTILLQQSTYGTTWHQKYCTRDTKSQAHMGTSWTPHGQDGWYI
jgi:hypothetical protein